MLNVGIAGIGFMGWIHWLAYQNTPGVRVAAIATPEPERQLGDWTEIKGNFGPPGTQVDLTGIATYASLDELLTQDDLDFVDICLPPAMHCNAIEKSAAAGKHVFCEKPLAMTAAQSAEIKRFAPSKYGAWTGTNLIWTGHCASRLSALCGATDVLLSCSALWKVFAAPPGHTCPS